MPGPASIPLTLLDPGPMRPVEALGPRSIDALRMLRISLTDRCNLRCGYCMPAEGVPFESKQGLLPVEGILDVAGVAHELGVRHFKLTGGEPTLRSELVEIVEGLRTLPDVELSLTSNGIHLPRLVDRLAEAGLDRVTVSLDSLREDRYRSLTGGGRIDLAWRGIDAVADRLGHPKLNVVVIRGVNDDEVVDFARLAAERDCSVRFIEFMPLGRSVFADLRPDEVLVTSDEIAARIESVFGPFGGDDVVDPGVGPARVRPLAGGRGRIGFIGAMSRPFCESCNRLRLDARGVLRSCLFDGGEIDLRPRIAAGREALRAAFVESVALKPVVHAATGDRAMSSIGG